MLAVIKLGAVVMPTTTAVGPGDLVDRMERGAARAVITNASEVHKFDDVPGDYLRIAVGAADPAGTPTGRAGRTTPPRMPSTCRPPNTRARDPTTACCSTSRPARRAGPSSSSTPSAPTPSGTCRRCTGWACSPATCTSTSAAPVGPSTRGPRFFAPWAAEATAFVYNYSRFDPAALLRVLHTHEVTSLCAPPTVWRMLINADLSPAAPARCARSSAPASRSTPRSSRRSRRRGA